MAARHKLNQGFIVGTLATAGLIGGVTGSWVAFGIAAGVGLLLNLYGGDIRLRSRQR